MAMWKKVLVVGLAVILGALPVLARVDPGLASTPNVSQQASVPLPEGKELGDEELLQAEGEFWWFVALVFCGAGIGALMAAVHERWADEDPYVIDRDDWREIGYGALAGALAVIMNMK